jgi:phage terminase large subunit-like protein
VSLLGAVKPRLHNQLWTGATRGHEVAKLAEDVGIPLLEWQRLVMDDLCAVDENGKFVRKTGLLIIARQNGKTHLARMRILAGLFIFGEKNIVSMSSNRGMAIDTFLKVVDVIESHDFLKSQVKQIRYANGQESVTLLNGAKFEIVAATRDGSRGKTADLLYIDELREISDEAYTAAKPVTRARANSQVLMTSNAGDAYSTVLNELRERALSYPPVSLGYWEYSAEPYCKLNDRAQWALSNPSLGHLISEEDIAEAIATSSVEATRTETLCQWIDSLTSPFPYRAFEDLTEQGLELSAGVGLTFFGVDIAPSRRQASLVIGMLMPDGRIGVGIAEQWISEVSVDDLTIANGVVKWAKIYKPQKILFDKYSTANIAKRLEQTGYRVQDMSGQVFYQACSELYDSIVAKRLVHNGQDALVAAINNCAAKTNDAGWRIVRRKSAGDVSAAIGLAMVVHELVIPTPKPQIFI